jgi:D-threo-aldose 1-dehydrogenase
MDKPDRFVPPGPLGFGGAPLGNMFGAITDNQAAATLEAAWDFGTRYFDTAPHYGAGLSEHRFGQMLRRQPRDSFVLSSKVGRLLTPDQSITTGPWPFHEGLPFRARYDYSADGTLRSIDDSLQRMGLSRLDIVYVHDIAEDAHGSGWKGILQEAMRGAGSTLSRLRDEGVIRAWGLGVNLVEACEAALKVADPDLFLLAGRYTLIDQQAVASLFPACQRRGVRVVIGGPFNSGLLAGGSHYNYVDADTKVRDAYTTLRRICERYNVHPAAAALQFCAAHPVVASVIPGTKDPEKVRQNVAMMHAPIPEHLWAELRAAGILHPDAPTPDG